ncbi:MAG: DNA alkylation repair protein [Candidatus Pacebacteria bacterium]|nr:DNA alkylation repair protein [Candidatus Paceibacterota bacterium]
MITKILKEIESKKNKKKDKTLSRFFKTGKGEYGEGDIFWGLTVPVSRQIALKHKDLPLSDVNLLLKNKVHEVRLIGLLVLVDKYKRSSFSEKEKIAKFYLKNTKYVNNWDLVDLSSHYILGDYLLSQPKKDILVQLAKSKNLWEQRIAIVSTYAFIRREKLDETFKIAKMFLGHDHDLIHKATGWMLREAGKKDEKALRKFLDANLSKMPRTMLRYAIEKFGEDIRMEYLKK